MLGEPKHDFFVVINKPWWPCLQKQYTHSSVLPVESGYDFVLMNKAILSMKVPNA